MDLNILAPLVPVIKKIFPSPTPRKVWQGVNKGGFSVIGCSAVLFPEEVQLNGAITTVRIRNKYVDLKVEYSRAAGAEFVIRETFHATKRSSTESFEFFFELDEIVGMRVNGEDISGFFPEFYAEQIRRVVHGLEDTAPVLSLADPTISTEDWRNK